RTRLRVDPRVQPFIAFNTRGLTPIMGEGKWICSFVQVAENEWQDVAAMEENGLIRFVPEATKERSVWEFLSCIGRGRREREDLIEEASLQTLWP
nr:hypothetical protein [Hyphomicrobium sp.]